MVMNPSKSSRRLKDAGEHVQFTVLGIQKRENLGKRNKKQFKNLLNGSKQLLDHCELG